MDDLKYKSFDDILLAWFDKRKKEAERFVDIDWWWASELGTCLRAQFLRRLGIKPRNLEARISFLGEMGKTCHIWLQDAVKDMGACVVMNLKLINTKYRYKGKLDIILDLGKKGHPYLSLTDIKTQRPEAFFRRLKQPKDQQVKWFQKMQLASYTLFAKPKYQIKDQRIYILDRGGGLRDEYVFKFGKPMFNKVIAELNTLNKYWGKKEVPPCSKDWYCKDLCRPHNKELLKVEKGEIKLEEFVRNHGT